MVYYHDPPAPDNKKPSVAPPNLARIVTKSEQNSRVQPWGLGTTQYGNLHKRDVRFRAKVDTPPRKRWFYAERIAQFYGNARRVAA